MTSMLRDARLRAFRLGILSAVSWLTCAMPGHAESVFADFGGTWRGSGTVSLADGSQDLIRCRATYGVRGDGAALSVDVSCASDSYSVHIIANAVLQGNALTGGWQETTRGIAGTVTGRIPAPDKLQATFTTVGGSLRLGASILGHRQTVEIASQGSDIRAVSIILTR